MAEFTFTMDDWKRIDGLDFTQILNDSNLFAFQGFDPAYTLETLRKRAVLAKKTQAEFKADLICLLTWYVTRGTRITHPKVMGRTKDDARAKIKKLIDVYRITTSTTNREDVTMGRLSAASPHVIARMMCDPKVGRIVGDPGTCPRYLCFPAGISLIPRYESHTELREKWLKWAYDFDATVNGTNKDPKNVDKFADIAFKSNLFLDDTRVGMLNALKDIHAGSKETKTEKP